MGPRFSDPGIFTVFLTTASTSTLEWSPIQSAICGCKLVNFNDIAGTGVSSLEKP